MKDQKEDTTIPRGNEQLSLIRPSSNTLQRGLKQSYAYTFHHHLNSPKTMFARRLITLGLKGLHKSGNIEEWINIDLSEMSKFAHIRGSRTQFEIKQLLTIQQCSFRFKKPDSDSFKSYVLIPSCEYDAEHKVFRMRFNKDLEDLLLKFANRFSYVNTDLFLAQSSYVKSRMCELLNYYYDTKKYVVRVDQLISLLGCPKDYTWNKIKDRIIDPLMVDLSNTALNFSYKAVKEGKRKEGGRRSIVSIEFIIIGQRNQNTERLKKGLIDLQLAPYQVEGIMSSLQDKVIFNQMHAIRLLMLDGEINNVGAYTWKSFCNLIAGAE